MIYWKHLLAWGAAFLATFLAGLAVGVSLKVQLTVDQFLNVTFFLITLVVAFVGLALALWLSARDRALAR